MASLPVLFYTPIKIRLYGHADWLLLLHEFTESFIMNFILKCLWLVVPQALFCLPCGVFTDNLFKVIVLSTFLFQITLQIYEGFLLSSDNLSDP